MIVRGDSQKLLRKLREGSVDHAIADPPYSDHVHKCGRRGCTGYTEPTRPGATRAQFNRTRDLGFDALTEDLRAFVARELVRVVRRWILVFTDHEGGEGWKQDIVKAGGEFVRFGVWHKLGAAPQFTGDRPGAGHEVIVIAHAPRPKGVRLRWNGGGRHAFWEFPIVLNRSGQDPRLHTTQKPLPLMEALIKDFTDPGESVLDPFAGSGTTAAAAKRLGRNALGFEVDPNYARKAQERLEATSYQGDLFASHPAKAPKADQLALDIGATPPARGGEPASVGAPAASEAE